MGHRASTCPPQRTKVFFVQVKEDVVGDAAVLLTTPLQVLPNDGSTTEGDTNVRVPLYAIRFDVLEDLIPVRATIPEPSVANTIGSRGGVGLGLHILLAARLGLAHLMSNIHDAKHVLLPADLEGVAGIPEHKGGTAAFEARHENVNFEILLRLEVASLAV